MKKYCYNTKGFTLLEILMAMLLFSVVIVFVFTAFSFQTISLAKNREIIEGDNLGVKDMEDEIQYIKEYQLGRKPDYNISAMDTRIVSIFSETRKRSIEVLEVEKNIGDDGKKITTFISKESVLNKDTPDIVEFDATLKVEGTEVDYAYLDEDFEITLDVKTNSNSLYYRNIYEWYISKPGHGIFVNRDKENLTPYQSFGIPRTLLDYKVRPNITGKKFIQRDMLDPNDYFGDTSPYSKDFKGGFINATAKSVSTNGKNDETGEETDMDVPIYIVGLPRSKLIYAHLDASFIEFNNPESLTPEEVDASLKNLGRNFDIDIKATDKSTGAPHITIKDFNTSIRSGKYYKYLDFKGDSVYKILGDYRKLVSDGGIVQIFIVARPKDGNLDATIASSDYAGNLPGWVLNFKGLKGRDRGGPYSSEDRNVKFKEDNINADGWNVFSIEYKAFGVTTVRVNGDIEPSEKLMFAELANGLAIGGYDDDWRIFEPSSVDIAEVVIYKGSKKKIGKYGQDMIEDYFISKYEIEPSPNIPGGYFSYWQ